MFSERCLRAGFTVSLLLAMMVSGHARPNHRPAGVEKYSARYKAEHIVIPKIEFRSTTLADAVEFLRQETYRLDADPDPERRGVNIFLKLPPPNSTPLETPRPSSGPLDDPPLPSFRKDRVTLFMQQIPLLEALRYIALQTDLNVVVEKYAVSLVPPGTKMKIVIVSP